MQGERWRFGAAEVLEFTMRHFRYPEIEQLLTAKAADGTDRYGQNLAASVLGVYNDDWEGGEIYRTYRADR